MNTLMYPLNLVGWQRSQVIAHAKALVGTINTASLNSPAVQGGPIRIIYDFLNLNSLEKAPVCNKVRIHLYILFGGYFCCILDLFKGAMLGYNLGLFWHYF